MLQLAASLAEHEQLQREIVAQTCSSASEAAMLRQQCTALARQLAEQEELLQTATLDAAAMAEGNAAEISSLRAKVQIGEVDCVQHPDFANRGMGRTRSLLRTN